MNAFWIRAVVCFLSVTMCFYGGCAVESVDAAADTETSGQIEGTISVVAQVERSNVRTFLPRKLGVLDGVGQWGLSAKDYVRQGAVFAVSAAAVVAPSQHSCDVRVPENACTNEGWLHVLPIVNENASEGSPQHLTGFWLRSEDVLLVQVSAPVLHPDAQGRKVDVGEARDLLTGSSRFAANRGTPLGIAARPLKATGFSPPASDGSIRPSDRVGVWDLTVGASIDAGDPSKLWVVRGADGYSLQTTAAVCSSTAPGCEGWQGLNESPLLAARASAWLEGFAVVGLVAFLVLLVVWYVRRNNRPETTITVVDTATGVPPVLDPAATISPGPTMTSAPLPTTAPTPPPPGSVPEIRCWPAENLMCRYTQYQGTWYCLCLRPTALSYNEAGQECGPLNFWPGTWEDGCAIPERDISQMGNACWFPDECPGGKKFNNDL